MWSTDTGLLAGYGCDDEGPFLTVDERVSPRWRRQRMRPLGQAFTLRALAGRYCTGRHDLDRNTSEPCPEQRAMFEPGFEQCVACMRATGFNPAFYNAAHVSEQQQRYNAGPHVVYLAHFGCGVLKVGITHERRGQRRLLEQGARMGAILARFDDAERARALEAQVASEFGVAETVRSARKRRLLGSPFNPEVAGRELLEMAQRVARVRPDVDPAPAALRFDARYGHPERWGATAADLSEIEPVTISGDCLGMIGGILVVAGRGAQAEQRFMCSIGELVGCAVELTGVLRPNRPVGQLLLPF